MKAPIETIYVNPDYAGGTNISDVPVHTPISSNVVYGQNPSLITNEYGQTMVNPDIPVPLNNAPLTPQQTQQQSNQLAQEIIQNIKDSVKDIVAPASSTTTQSSSTTTPTKETTTSTTKSNSPAENLVKDVKAIQENKQTQSKPKTNYILYGALALGGLVVLMGIFKKK
jgi:hypothetical protein